MPSAAAQSDAADGCSVSRHPSQLVVTWGEANVDSNAVIGVSLDLDNNPPTRYFRLNQTNTEATPDGARNWSRVEYPKGLASFVGKVVLSIVNDDGSMQLVQTCGLSTPVDTQSPACTWTYNAGTYQVRLPDPVPGSSYTSQIRFGADNVWETFVFELSSDRTPPAEVRIVRWAFTGKFGLYVEYLPTVCTPGEADPDPDPDPDPEPDPEPEPDPVGCSVVGVAGGVAASWPAVPGAVTYVWGLEVAGASTRYNRVNATSTTIPVPAGTQARVRVSGVFANGSYSGAVDCGVAAAGDADPSGPTDPDPNPDPVGCSVSPRPDGIRITWGDGAEAFSSRAVIGVSFDVSTRPNTRYFRLNEENSLGATPDGKAIWSQLSLEFGYSTYIDRVVLSERDADGRLEPVQTCEVAQPQGQTRGCTFTYIDGTYLVRPDRFGGASFSAQARVPGGEWLPYGLEFESADPSLEVRMIDWVFSSKFALFGQSVPTVCTAAGA